MCRLWDTYRGQQIGQPLLCSFYVVGVAFAGDGKTAFAVSNGQDGRQMHRWNLESSRLLGATGGQTTPVWRLAADPQGVTLVTGSYVNGPIRIWDGATGQPRGAPLQHDGPIQGVAISADGRTILTGSDDRTTRLWDAFTGKPLGPSVRHPYGISAVAFSPNGQHFLTGSKGQTVQLWDTTWQPLGVPMRHRGEVKSVVFVPASPLLLSGSDDNTARFWFGPTSHPVGPPLTHSARVNAVAISPDGRIAATASDDFLARLWPVPLPVTEETERLTGWVQVLTGLEMDDKGGITVTPADEWRQRRDRFYPLPSLPER